MGEDSLVGPRPRGVPPKDKRRSDAGAARLRRFKRQFGPKRLSRQKLLGHHSVVIRGRRMLEHIEGLHEFIGQGGTRQRRSAGRMSICEAAQALNEPSRKGRIANRIRNARKPFDPPRSGIIGRPPPKRGLTVVNRCERIVERRVAERSAIGCRTCSFTETNNALQAFGLFTGLQKRRLELLEPFGSGTLFGFRSRLRSNDHGAGLQATRPLIPGRSGSAAAPASPVAFSLLGSWSSPVTFTD